MRDFICKEGAVEYRRLGKTELMASVVGFGAEWIGKMEDVDVLGLVDRATEAGVNIVDCWMSDPAIRDALGRALKGKRDQWIIQGHVGSTWQDGQHVRTRDMRHVRPAFEDLLQRLGTDHLDIGMVHYVDYVDEFESIMQGEFFAYMRELKACGKIRHIGLSTHNPEIVIRAAECGEIETVMYSVNPVYDLMPTFTTHGKPIVATFGEAFAQMDEGLGQMDPVRVEAYAACERHDVGITVMKAYVGGRLLDAEKSPFGVALTPVQCLHYALTRPAVGSVMVGMESVPQLEEALAYQDAQESQLDYASVLAVAPKHAFAGQCTYCGHCAPCMAGINIALVSKYLDLASLHGEVPASVRDHYLGLDVRADACTGCQDCESRCPFGVPIAQRMQQAAELFA